MNQCDGCRARKPLDQNGNHAMGEPGGYRDLMACQRSKYEPPKKRWTKEQAKNLQTLLKMYGEKGKRREVRRYVRYSKHELEANLREIATERARGAEPYRRPHLRYIKRRSIQGLAVIDAFYASIKQDAA